MDFAGMCANNMRWLIVSSSPAAVDPATSTWENISGTRVLDGQLASLDFMLHFKVAVHWVRLRRKSWSAFGVPNSLPHLVSSTFLKRVFVTLYYVWAGTYAIFVTGRGVVHTRQILEQCVDGRITVKYRLRSGTMIVLNVHLNYHSHSETLDFIVRLFIDSSHYPM